MKQNEQNKKQFNNANNVELGQDYDINQEAIDTLVATKAGGMITRKLVELGERALINEENSKK